MILISTLMPAVTKAKAISEQLYHNRLVNLYRVMFLVFLLIATPIYFFAEDVVSLLYGKVPTGWLFAILVCIEVVLQQYGSR